MSVNGESVELRDDSEYTDMSDFEMFKERMEKRHSSVNMTSLELEVPGNKALHRRKSSVMIEYFRDNYMGIEASVSLIHLVSVVL